MALPENFYIPPSATVHGETAKYRCLLCKEPFWDRDQYSRHMKQCSDQREEQMREHSLRHKAPELWDDQNGGDVEYRNYVRRTGRLH